MDLTYLLILSTPLTFVFLFSVLSPSTSTSASSVLFHIAAPPSIHLYSICIHRAVLQVYEPHIFHLFLMLIRFIPIRCIPNSSAYLPYGLSRFRMSIYSLPRYLPCYTQYYSLFTVFTLFSHPSPVALVSPFFAVFSRMLGSIESSMLLYLSCSVNNHWIPVSTGPLSHPSWNLRRRGCERVSSGAGLSFTRCHGMFPEPPYRLRLPHLNMYLCVLPVGYVLCLRSFYLYLLYL